MPILASLGTANDRAFGFGDSSFKFAFGRVTLSAPVSMELLLVGGGGAGGGTGRDPYIRGGGGGAGGLIHDTQTIAAGSYEVVVGLGGANKLPTGGNGQNTTAFGLVALGGGGGGSTGAPNASSGGSGGGASTGYGGSGTSGQGNNGGNQLATGNQWGAAGGGGAGTAGGDAGSATAGGSGGNGLQFSISGTPTYYAGGGGGGEQTQGYPGQGGLGGGGRGGYTYPGTDGTDDLGGGGGGSGYGGNADNRPAGKGGSGVVIIKYLTTEDSKVTIVNGEKAIQGVYTICKFTKEYNSVVPTLDYSLPSIITNNAEIIYDASNPLSVRSSIDFNIAYTPTLEAVMWDFGTYQTLRLYHIIPSQYNVQVGDKIGIEDGGNPVYYVSVLGVTRNVTEVMDQGGNPVTVTGDKVVINAYSYYWGQVRHLYYKPQANTWYDISGNSRHATWSSAPVVSGVNVNQILTADSSHILSVPDAVTNSFVYFMLINKGADISVLGTYNGSTTWRLSRFISNGLPYFTTTGGGGDQIYGTQLDNYDNRPQWTLYRGEINGPGAVTRYGGFTTYANCGRDFSGTQHSQMTVGDGTGSVPIKFIALYRPENAPTIEQAYNALKGRFGL